MCDGADLDDGQRPRDSVLTRELAENALDVTLAGEDLALYDDLRLGWDFQIIGNAPDQRDRLAEEPAGEAHLVLVEARAELGGDEYGRMHADDDRNGQRSTTCLGGLVVRPHVRGRHPDAQ